MKPTGYRKCRTNTESVATSAKFLYRPDFTHRCLRHLSLYLLESRLINDLESPISLQHRKLGNDRLNPRAFAADRRCLLIGSPIDFPSNGRS